MTEELRDGTLLVSGGNTRKMNVPENALPCSRCNDKYHELWENNDSANTDASHVAIRVNLV